MRSKLVLAAILSVVSAAYAKDPKTFQSGKLMQMDSVSCGMAEKDAKSFACHFLPGTEKMVFGRGGGLNEVLYCGFGFVHTRKGIYERIKERIGLPAQSESFLACRCMNT